VDIFEFLSMFFDEDGSVNYLSTGVGLLFSLFLANSLAVFLEYCQKRKIEHALATLSSRGVHTEGAGKIPICIVTGFLGSGKTTLLNAILKNPKLEQKLAVVVNEVGEVSIDHELIKRNLTDDGSVMVMKNGCLCCVSSGSSGGGELERVLEQLVKLKEDSGLDGVIVELSGLADPTPTVHTLLSDQFAKSKFFLDGIVCMVDSNNFSDNLRGRKLKELERQLVYASLIVLNKCDLVEDEEKISACYELISSTNSLAKTYESVYSDVPLGVLFNQRAFDTALCDRILRSAAHSHDDHHHGHSHGHVHTKRMMSHSVVTDTVARYVDDSSLSAWLDTVLKQSYGELYRVKGIIYIYGHEAPFVLQGVQSIVKMDQVEDYDESRTNGTHYPSCSSIVFIGIGLDKQKLQRGFSECIVFEEEEEDVDLSF
jgi:G3E family GTPase